MYHIPNLFRPIILLVLIFWQSAQAAEWSARPRISVSTRYDDNIRLSSAKHDAVIQKSLDSSVRFGVARKHQGLFGNAGFSLRRFTGGSGAESSSELNRENYYLGTDAYHNTLLDSLRLTLNLTRDSTLDSELDETGNVNSSRATRQSISLAPSWLHRINEKTQANLSAQLSQVTFPDDPGVKNLVESDNYSLSSILSYQLSQLVSGNLSVAYSGFQPDTGFNSETLNLQLGISRVFSPTLSANWLAGWRETTSDSRFITGICLGAIPGASFPTCTGAPPAGAIATGTATQKITNTGLVYTGNLSKRLENGSLDISVSRATTPTSTGELLDTTRLSMNSIHHLSSGLDATLSMSYTDNETIVNSTGNNTGTGSNKLLTVSPGLSWQWSRQLRVALRYEYVRSEAADTGKTATRNAVSASLDYDFRKLSVSR